MNQSTSNSMNSKDAIQLGFVTIMQLPNLLVNFSNTHEFYASLANVIGVLLGIAFILYVNGPSKQEVIEDVRAIVSNKLTNDK